MCLYLPIKRVVAGASLLRFLFVCPFFVFSMLKIVTVNGIDVYASMTHTHLKQFIVMYLLYVVCCMSKSSSLFYRFALISIVMSS